MPSGFPYTLIQCLTAIAQHHGRQINPDQLISDYALPAEEPGLPLLLRIAAHIGLSAKVDTLSWEELLAQEENFPVLARLANGNGVIVVGIRAEENKVAILDPLNSQVGVFLLEREPFCTGWKGEVVFLKPFSALSSQDLLVEAINLQNQGHLDEAVQCFREILSVDPGNGAAFYSLGVIALNRGEAAEALQLSEQGIQSAPEFAPLRFLQGSALQGLDRYEEALHSYDEALRIKPDYLEVLINSGVLLRVMGHHHEALQRFNQVLTIDPNYTSALANCGVLLTEFKQSETAIGMFERLLEINPDYDYGPGLLCYERLHICDWTGFEKVSREIIEGIRAGRRSCKTLAFMALSDSANDHLLAAKIFAESHCPRKPVALWQGEHYHHDKIRIAYVSPDLREHPVGHLMAGIFEHHDKSRFELIAISLGIDDQSRLRARMLKAFDRFIDVRLMSARQIAQMMREMEIDIAVDLAGYTADSRTEIFAYRPVPVQVNYLGYPGTMGTDYMDYILADRQVIPEDYQRFYTEKVAYLPDTYLPTDASVEISERTPSRAECGLPESGIVFCSFSHDYKINPAMFTVWMRLLQQTPGSVLWLMSRGDTAQLNLMLQAEERGVDPSRLVFANRVPRVEDHLARYRQADLFLDTHPYNAHTTAADALMAGLPVVTYRGDAFPSRVAGSLLHAIGLPELITHSLEEYEALVLKLAQDRLLLADAKARLAANKAIYPLFDTDRFCRSLEAAYIQMYDQVESDQAQVKKITKTRSLDLGCGPQPKNPFSADEVFGIDVRDDLEVNIRRADLAIEPIPFDDDSFEYVSAYDFLEHVPRVLYVPTRRNAFVELMNEIYRVLKMGGLFLSFTPAYPQPAAFQDPTHINIITDQTFPLYFDNVNRWSVGYGFKGAFVIRLQEWRGPHLLTVMQKMPCGGISMSDKSVVSTPVQELPTPIVKLSGSPSAMVDLHEKHWSGFLGDARNRSLYDSWWNVDRVNFWRHTRLLSPVLEVLSAMKAYSWLTIGDGSGTDAWMLLRTGFRSVLATDLDDTVLAEIQRRGYIKDFKVENAEALGFADGSFDFVLCKESLHHMNRPYAAIYEILRVAKYGVVVIEPQDPWIDWPCRTDATEPHYEAVGNYVYQFSARELEKIAYGMNIAGVATKSLVDVYIPDCEFALCNDSDPIWIETKKQVEESEKAVAQGTAKPNYILSILFKNSVDQGVLQMLAGQHSDWTFKSTDTNPYLRPANI
jgi:predicted O-linked N-acetylglucosamine transferase (SPINDLY family)/SAM-dependent methyltransferase